MRVRYSPHLFSIVLLVTAALSGVDAVPEPNALAGPSPKGIESSRVFNRDEHAHSLGHEHAHGHSEPLLELNETLILMWHKPTPPSYGTHDFEDPEVTHKYPHLMALHVVLMSLAFFGALPIGIALRSVNHGLHGLSIAFFYVFVALGLAFSGLYRKLTPNLYENAKHGPQGYLVLLLASLLTTVDALAALTRAYHYFTALRRGELVFSVKGFWRSVVLNKDEHDLEIGSKQYLHEYAELVEEPEELEMDIHELKAVDDHRAHLNPVDFNSGLQSPASESSTERWANEVHHQHHSRGSAWRNSIASDGTLFHAQPLRHGSHHSDETLHEHELSAHVAEAKELLVQRIGRVVFATAERVLVFLGYMQMLTGLVTYSGVCRDTYVNGCLAHLIKGGIFWCYGLVSFARFLGSFSELGWAWNRAPRSSSSAPSAEFVECLVIFLYGITNTWMERFGAKPGDPFTTKEVQHISIAVMFWFAGLVGMGIESKTVRRWLAAPATELSSIEHPSSRSGRGDLTLKLPPSYRASFNPFPALVIGVTGLAMAAHAQVYLFQVQIHSLWGQLLAGFALLRCLTYFFLWLAPPSSPLPSRPPTEALASFFLACGGLVFQMSLEELDLAAMRRGHDDVMMFLNVAVAVTCLAFCWVLAVVTFKAWLQVRENVKSEAKRAQASA